MLALFDRIFGLIAAVLVMSAAMVTAVILVIIGWGLIVLCISAACTYYLLFRPIFVRMVNIMFTNEGRKD